jgi:hypothetical protein
MKLRIVSDGFGNGTRLETEDGEQIEGVVKINWHADSGRYLSTAEVELIGVAVDAKVTAGAVVCNCGPAGGEVVCRKRIERSIYDVYGAPRQE